MGLIILLLLYKPWACLVEEILFISAAQRWLKQILFQEDFGEKLNVPATEGGLLLCYCRSASFACSMVIARALRGPCRACRISEAYARGGAGL